MPQINDVSLETMLRVLALLALALYFAPATFGSRFAARNRPWMHRAAIAVLAIGVVIALAMSVRWFIR